MTIQKAIAVFKVRDTRPKTKARKNEIEKENSRVI